MSESTFRRRLLAVAGETPKAYISAIQMQKASSLLTTRHDLSISDVAMQCGFEEASSFTRAFKRVYGVAPSQYPATEE
jgi:AraC-like DNA-binding protein